MKLLERYDLVSVFGTRYIIVDVIPSRPANPYIAVKENGNGAKYKLGHKHSPKKVGTVPPDHPAVNATMFRDFDRLGGEAKDMLRQVLQGLIDGKDGAKSQASQMMGMLR